MTAPRLIIVGPGALGCGLGALLAERGANIALLDYRPHRARYIQAHGIRVHEQDRWRTVRVPCSADPSCLGVADLLIVLVKAHATADAIQHARPCVGAYTAVLTLQNGLGNHETLAQYVPAVQVLAGTIVMGCATLAVGEVRLSGLGEIVLGSPVANHCLAGRMTALLARWWPQVRHEPHIDRALWRKVIINAGINPLTALHRVCNGELLRDPRLRERLGKIVREATAVAVACGADPFGDEDPVAAVEQVCRLTATNRSSMLQDTEAGRRTEIDAICGEIVRRGEAAGVSAPLCRELMQQVQLASRSV